jgi:hypothetical protein
MKRILVSVGRQILAGGSLLRSGETQSAILRLVSMRSDTILPQ